MAVLATASFVSSVSIFRVILSTRADRREHHTESLKASKGGLVGHATRRPLRYSAPSKKKVPPGAGWRAAWGAVNVSLPQAVGPRLDIPLW